MTCKGAYLVFVKLVYPKKITELDRKEMLSLFLKSCMYACWREEIVTILGRSGHFREVTITHHAPTAMECKLQAVISGEEAAF